MKRGGGRPEAYRCKDGKRVPSVSTITGRFKEAGGLVRWAYNCGRDGIDMDKARDGAADAGSMAHAWIEDTVHGTPLTEFPDMPEETHELARVGLSAFLDYRDQVKLEVLSTEVPLVSEIHRFGGTYDAVVRINGKLYVWDIKSGNRVYPEHLSQVSGYQILLEEHGYEGFEGAQILRVGKQYGDFHVHNYPQTIVNRGREAFMMMRRLYDLDKELGKVAA